MSLCIVLTTLFTVIDATAQADKSGNPKISSRSVVFIAGGAVVPSAGSTLFRSQGGVYFDFHTSSLTPGDAVSLWLAVFNNPEFCATSPCTPADFGNLAVDGTLFSTGGIVVGRDRKGVYGAYRAVGDVTGARPGVGTGNGLLNPLTAEIHIVTRTHGVASMDPATLELQLTTFFGNCPPNMCTSIQTSIHQR
ncbi:MAG: hypothetical protein ABI646_05710 [Acidobacteriota bacterium]